MREALAELKLSNTFEEVGNLEYGHDIALEEDASPVSNSDDLWDLDEDDQQYEDDDYGTDIYRESFPDARDSNLSYNHTWVTEKCIEFAKRSHGLDAKELQEQILAVLSSESSGTEYPAR